MVIVLGVISLASILLIQGIWINKTITMQQTDIAIQEKEDSLDHKHFAEQVHIALRNVLEKISTVQSYSQNVHRDFQYGIYDCFTDSIVFGNLIKFTKTSLYAPASDTLAGITSEKLSWKKDGHYFTVYFPGITNKHEHYNEIGISPWWYMALIVVFVLIFFGFAIAVIIRQKRLSEVKNDFIRYCYKTIDGVVYYF